MWGRAKLGALLSIACSCAATGAEEDIPTSFVPPRGSVEATAQAAPTAVSSATPAVSAVETFASSKTAPAREPPVKEEVCKKGPVPKCGCRPGDLECAIICGDPWYNAAPKSMMRSCLSQCQKGVAGACLRAGIALRYEAKEGDVTTTKMAADVLRRGCELGSMSACIIAKR